MRQPTRHIETVQHEHSEIVKAIASGDTQKSGELMRFHLRTAQARLFSGEDENAQYLWNKNL